MDGQNDRQTASKSRERDRERETTPTHKLEKEKILAWHYVGDALAHQSASGLAQEPMTQSAAQHSG